MPLCAREADTGRRTNVVLASHNVGGRMNRTTLIKREVPWHHPIPALRSVPVLDVGFLTPQVQVFVGEEFFSVWQIIISSRRLSSISSRLSAIRFPISKVDQLG